LRVLIQNAYQLLQDAQLVGGPSWLTSDTFDIVATIAGNPPHEQIPLMLRALMALLLSGTPSKAVSVSKSS
jgi:uncharacterized protein (TIGR03435 family)